MSVFLGVDIGGTNVKTAVINDQGRIADKRSFDTHPEEGFEGFGARLRQSLEQGIAAAGLTLADVKGVGVGIPGFLDIEQGVIVEAVNLGWKNVPFVRLLQSALDLPVVIENDANVAALGEAWTGAGRGASSVLCATVGTGVGGGIVIGGRLYRGVNGMAGEIGHLVVNHGGHRCNCGNIGCLETVASATAIVRNARSLQERGLIPQDVELSGAEDVFALAVNGNAEAAGVVQEAAAWLGYGLSLSAVTLNPDAIVIGGGVSKAKDMLLRPVQEAFKRYALHLVVDAAKIQLAELGNDAGVVGAARLAVQHVLGDR